MLLIFSAFGADLPPELPFRDHAGRSVTLADYLDEGPVVLTLGYYRCPLLCGLVVTSTAEIVRSLDGVTFLTISFDPVDTPAEAAVARHRALAVLRGATAPPREEWPFLVGDRASIDALLGALDLSVTLDPRTNEYTHPAVVLVANPSGHVTHVLHGAPPDADELRAAVQAAATRGTPTVTRWFLECGRVLTQRADVWIALALGGLLGGAWHRATGRS